LTQATTGAWHDNTASLGVTSSLPYTQTGCSIQQRRERPDTMLEFAISRAQWNAVRRNDIDLIGMDAPGRSSSPRVTFRQQTIVPPTDNKVSWF